MIWVRTTPALPTTFVHVPHAALFHITLVTFTSRRRHKMVVVFQHSNCISSIPATIVHMSIAVIKSFTRNWPWWCSYSNHHLVPTSHYGIPCRHKHKDDTRMASSPLLSLSTLPDHDTLHCTVSTCSAYIPATVVNFLCYNAYSLLSYVIWNL